MPNSRIACTASIDFAVSACIARAEQMAANDIEQFLALMV
jgi:hypothetical protein